MSEIDLQDAVLRHSLQILRLAAGEQAALEPELRRLAEELRALVQTASLSDATQREIERLIAEAEKVIDPAYRTMAASVDTRTLALVVAEQTVELLEDLTPEGIDLPTRETLDSLTRDVLIDGAPSSAWWDRQAEDLRFRFAQQVRQGVANGETSERIVQRVVGRRGEPGILDVSRRNARALVHSSVMTAANQARLATFRNNGRMFAGVRWLATLDGHTCPRCAALDGQAWDLDGERLPGTKVDFLTPPIHFGDRCVLSPIPKTDALEAAFPGISARFAAVGGRASSQGTVHGSTTFQQFLERQSPAFVERTLGKRRADLFAQGKITVRDLVSGSGRELTLDELRTR